MTGALNPSHRKDGGDYLGVCGGDGGGVAQVAGFDAPEVIAALLEHVEVLLDEDDADALRAFLCDALLHELDVFGLHAFAGFVEH